MEKKLKKNFLGLIAIATTLGVINPTYAESDVTIENDLNIVSDYVYRGLSRSDSGWALQGNFTAFHDDGAYMGVFMSSLNLEFNDHVLETEVFGGYTFSSGAYDYDLSLSYDALMGGVDEGYFELRSSIARDYGLAYIKGGIAYTPWGREVGDGDSAYVYTDLDIPLPISNIPPMLLALHVGYENFEGTLDKLDWSVGMFMEVVGIEIGVKYTDVKDGNPLFSENRVTFNLKKYF